MIIILIRTLILYLMVLFAIRLMGKGELSSLDPVQLVVLFMIAELAAIPIESTDVSVISGITAIMTLVLLEVVLSFISIKSKRFDDFINGRPSIIIDNGNLNLEELKNLRITIDELTEQLRLKNFPSIADVDYAILETNGELSVMPKTEKNPATKGDLRKNKNTTGNKSNNIQLIPMVLISDGVLIEHNLRSLNKDENYLRTELHKHRISDYSQVFLCFFDEKGKIHVYSKAGQKSEPQAGQRNNPKKDQPNRKGAGKP